MPEPFEVAIPDETLEDLRGRLERARFSADFANDDWRYGTEGGYLRELVDYWVDGYDWRAEERAINAVSHFRQEVDGVPIHFIHERGKGPDPIPLILNHGWPWTFWDFYKVIGPLSDPGAFGGDPADAFDVVVPSLPGFGFSEPLGVTGVNFSRTAELWLTLMRDVLGYDRFATQGGDWGALVAEQLGHKYAEHLIGVHLSLAFPLDFFTAGLPEKEDYAPEEMHRYEQTQSAFELATSQVVVHSTEPQTLAFALNDSPLGLCSWIVERRRNYSDCGGEVERSYTKDELLTGVMLYWVTETIGTSLRYYWEAKHNPWTPAHDRTPVVEAPTGIALFPRDNCLLPDALLRSYYNVQQLTEMPSGGHFAPMEEPELFVENVRQFFRPLRAGADG